MYEIARFQRLVRSTGGRLARPGGGRTIRSRLRRDRQAVQRGLVCEPRPRCAPEGRLDRCSRRRGKRRESALVRSNAAFRARESPRGERSRTTSSTDSAPGAAEPVVVVLVDEEDSKGAVSLPFERFEQKSDLVRLDRQLRGRGRRKERRAATRRYAIARASLSFPSSSPCTTTRATSATPSKACCVRPWATSSWSSSRTPRATRTPGCSREFPIRDPRMRNDEQLGLATSLNRGLEVGTGGLRRSPRLGRRRVSRVARAQLAESVRAPHGDRRHGNRRSRRR